jgi:peroxiredoxin
MKRLLVAVIGAVCAGFAGASEAPRLAPDFALKSMSGANLRLSEHVGEVVVVNFWATWCGPCREEMPVLERLHRQYSKAGLLVLGINMDEDTGGARAMARRLDVTFPVLFDAGKRVAKGYKVASMPATFIVDRDGHVRHQHLGYVPETAEAYEREVRTLLKE